MTPPNPQEKPNIAYALVAFVSSVNQYHVDERLVGLTGNISNRPSEYPYGTSEDTLDKSDTDCLWKLDISYCPRLEDFELTLSEVPNTVKAMALP